MSDQKKKYNPFLIFLAIAVPLYAIWYVSYVSFLQGGAIDHAIIANLTETSSWLLDLMGYEVLPEPTPDIRTVGIDGGHYVWVGDECDGFSLFALFSIFMAAFPGPWRKKLWFIPMGLVIIHLLNIIRITALVIIVKYAPNALDFNHTYVFTTLVYAVIFMLWLWWVEKFSGYSLRKRKKKDSKEALA